MTEFNIRNIVETTLVPHTDFKLGLQRIEQCYIYSKGAVESNCLAIIGETRTGKSRLLEEFCVLHSRERKRTTDGLTVPILKVKTPSKPTVKGLAELMLQALSDPKYLAGTENAKSLRLHDLLRATGVHMIMIDEFQHFYDKSSRKVWHHVADWLKILVDDCCATLVVAGLPTCRAVIDQNEQLSGRFLAPIVLARLDWSIPSQRDDFISILESFQEALSSHFELPVLSGKSMAFRCFCATGGLMGFLVKILRQAVWNALDNGVRSISMEDLSLAHDQSIWKTDGLKGLVTPFSRDFKFEPDEELLARIRSIGTPREDEPEAEVKSSCRKKGLALGDVLSAS
jgi:hypothetical protein